MAFTRLMGPFSRIFGPAPSPPHSREARVASLELAPAEEIVATALAAGDDQLRAAAVCKLEHGEALSNLAGLSAGATPVPSGLRRLAQARVAQLLDAGAIDFDGLSAATGSADALLTVASLCGNGTLLAQTIASIDDPHRLATLVVDGPTSRVRQFAAHRVADPAQLKELLTRTRGKDNGVYKIIKRKCDAMHALEQQAAQLATDLEMACKSLERHSRRAYDDVYVASFRYIRDQWQSLEAQAPLALQQLGSAAIARCEEVIAEHARQLAQQALHAAQQAAYEAARQAAREEAAALAEADIQRRNQLAALAAADALQTRQAEERARAERLSSEALALRQISGLIGKANGALRAGDTGRAAGLHGAITEKLSMIPAVPPHLSRQVEQLAAKLNELKEWKDYAVAPKRAELILEMEALTGSSEEPRALAERIKQLQEDWKTVSKGIVSESEADWQRFQQASAAAYQPCREYFEAQARLRRENLEQRHAVLRRLVAFEAAQNPELPDWRTISAVLREARREWRRHSPVDRTAGVASQKEFDASLGRLQASLNAWYTANVAAKQSLIQRAQQLREIEDAREATDAVKQLQQLWKQVGAAPQADEQRLWEAFRAQCDAVFKRREQAHTEYLAGLEANRVGAVALCEEAERLADLSGQTLLDGAAQIPQWRAAFEAIGEMPRTEQRDVTRRFERALALCQTAVAQLRARHKEQSFTDLLEAARHINTFGWATAQGLPPAERDALRLSGEAFIADVQHWPKGGVQALQDAWAHARAATHAGIAINETVFRMLCIRSEILTDTATPSEDQSLRREYQVNRLVQRMSQGNDPAIDDLDNMVLEWVRIGTVAPATYELLLARFARCRRSNR